MSERMWPHGIRQIGWMSWPTQTAEAKMPADEREMLNESRVVFGAMMAASKPKASITSGLSSTCSQYMRPRFEDWSWETIFCEAHLILREREIAPEDLTAIRETFRAGYVNYFSRPPLSVDLHPAAISDTPRPWELSDKYQGSLHIVPDGTPADQLWVPEAFAVPGKEAQREHFWSAVLED